MTRGCAKTAAGERQRLTAEYDLRDAMFKYENERRKELGERCAATAESVLTRELPSTLFQEAEIQKGSDGKGALDGGMDMDQCFAALEGGLEAFRKVSAAEEATPLLLPEAPRNVCTALQRRVLPALRSAMRARKTRWQIAESELSRLGTSEVSIPGGG